MGKSGTTKEGRCHSPAAGVSAKRTDLPLERGVLAARVEA